jgi:hypothetical protein
LNLFAARAAKLSELLLFDSSQQRHDDRTGDREQNTRARQAAEALFAPKRQPPEQSSQEAQSSREAPAPASEPVRRPRVLAISPTAPSPRPRQERLEPPSPHQERPAEPTSPKEQVASKIPQSQFARIRAWQRYGMTAQQVAEVYGVSVGEIERIVGAA